MTKTTIFSLITMAILGLNGCGGSSEKTSELSQNVETNSTTDTNISDVENNTTSNEEVAKTQYISYMLNNEALIVEAKEEGEVTNVSKHLAGINTGEEKWINISPNGEWLLLESTKLDEDCEGWGCLIYGKRDLSEFKTIKTANNEVIHTEGFSAISSTGDFIVIHMSGEQRNDLFVSKNTNDVWSDLKSITENSPSNDNKNPAISADGTEVLFDCGENICIVNSDGSNFKTLIKPQDGNFDAVRYADFGTKRDIIFEGDNGSEQIWIYNRETKKIIIMDESKANDNSPCVLSNGEVVSLWMEREREGDSIHELKVMTNASHFMAVTNQDITDFGIGCGGL